MKRWMKQCSALALSAVLLTGMLPVPAGAAEGSGFQDVSQTAYYAQAVEWAVDYYIAQVQDAIRKGERELLIQCDNTTQLSYIREAVDTVKNSTRGNPDSFDGYTAGEDYWISYGYNTNPGTQIIRLTIGYPAGE